MVLAAVLAFTIGISLTVTGGVAAAVVAYKLFTNVKATASPRQGILVSVSLLAPAEYCTEISVADARLYDALSSP